MVEGLLSQILPHFPGLLHQLSPTVDKGTQQALVCIALSSIKAAGHKDFK